MSSVEHEFIYGNVLANLAFVYGLLHFAYLYVRKWRKLIQTFFQQHHDMYEFYKDELIKHKIQRQIESGISVSQEVH